MPVGSVPGVLLGARISARAPAGLIRPVLVVLLASALKLLGQPNLVVAVAVAVAVVALILAAEALRRHLIGQTTPSSSQTTPVPVTPARPS